MINKSKYSSPILEDALLTTEDERELTKLFQANQLSTLLMQSVEYDEELHAPEIDGPSGEVSKSETLGHLQAEISKLKPQHQQILSWYFGLSGDGERTPAEIIKDTGHTSTSAINKIITKTIKALQLGMKRRGHET